MEKNKKLESTTFQKLEDLKILKQKMQQLDKIKQQISHSTEIMQNEEDLIGEFRAEKESLTNEYKYRVAEIRAIQFDIGQVDSVIQAAEQEKGDMQQQIDQIVNEQYHPLKEAIDNIRVSLGLPRLPSLQEENEKILSIYLEKRRKNWNEDINNGTATTHHHHHTRASKKRKKG